MTEIENNMVVRNAANTARTLGKLAQNFKEGNIDTCADVNPENGWDGLHCGELLLDSGRDEGNQAKARRLERPFRGAHGASYCMKRAEHLPTLRGDALAVNLALAALVLITVLCNALRPRRFDNLEINGTAAFKEQIANSLIMLRSRSPQSYGVVTSYIGRILQAKHSGMAAYQDPPTLELNDRTAFYSLTWCASSIAHDSIHSKLYNDYRKLRPEGAYAPDEVWTGAEAERKCREQQMRVLQQLRAPLNEIKWLAQTNNRYWEIDYTKRDW